VTPAFLWIRWDGENWITELFTGASRLEAGKACAAKIVELGMQGQGLVIEPELMLREGGVK